MWVWNLVDFALDWLFIGIFFWFKPIAYVFIWIINVAQLPINMIGWGNEFLTGLHKLPLEFWMWFFGDGCFLRWGKNCWTDWRLPFRSDRTFMDISIFGKDLDVAPIAEPSKPAFTNKSAWSTDFAQRFGFDDITASIEQWNLEQKLNQINEERKKARDQRLIEQQVAFDSSALGMLLIKLQALIHDIASPIDF